MTVDRCARYVYYRVRDQDEARLRTALADLCERLRTPVEGHAGPIAGPAVTLSRRLDPTDNDRALGATTWLEIHAFAVHAVSERPAIDDWIEASAVAAGVAALAIDGRRVEWFVTCA